MATKTEAKFTTGSIETSERTGGVVLLAPSVGPANPEHGHFRIIGIATQRDPHPKYGGGVSLETAHANARLWAQAHAMYVLLNDLAEHIDEEMDLDRDDKPNWAMRLGAKFSDRFSAVLNAVEAQS